MTEKKIVYVYLLDTLADWEPGFALAELRTGRFFRKDTPAFDIKTISLTLDPITTMGGLRIIPDLTVAEATPENAALLLMPGGATWMQPLHAPILEKAKEFLAADVPVAAICGATIALASAGLLDSVDHTSNDLRYLKSICPDYRGENFYKSDPAVIGGNIITSGGTSPVDFARAILKRLDVMDDEYIEAWYSLYITHEARYFLKLMEGSDWRPGSD